MAANGKSQIEMDAAVGGDGDILWVHGKRNRNRRWSQTASSSQELWTSLHLKAPELTQHDISLLNLWLGRSGSRPFTQRLSAHPSGGGLRQALGTRKSSLPFPSAPPPLSIRMFENHLA
jgi:hypothetical protein